MGLGKQSFEIYKVRFHFHKWNTTHTNGYMLPTRQICRCGEERSVETNKERHDNEFPRMKYRWDYSTGKKGPWRRMADGEKVKL